MRITCPKCHGVKTVDEKTVACPDCHTILRRCVDCARFDVRMAICRAVNRPVQTAAISYPTYSSMSAYCRAYEAITPPPAEAA